MLLDIRFVVNIKINKIKKIEAAIGVVASNLFNGFYQPQIIAMAVPHDCTQLCEGCDPSVLGFIPRLTIASYLN
tara:strand:- start:32 stop:253 length:222 start_codon:yes stop_codon:yes gene_type:complete